MDYNLKEVARRIKDLREAKGYTTEELAKLTGVSPEDYLVLEKGETDFSFTFIYKCAKACGVEVVDILEGTSSTLTSFAITRKGEGLKIIKKKGFVYNNLAPKFKDKLAEPFLVKFPYLEEEQNAPIKLNSHNGQEFDVIVKGKLKVQVGEHVDVLSEGDSIFYNSLIPHGMIAVSEGGCEFHAVVLNPQDGQVSEEYPEAPFIAAKTAVAEKTLRSVADKFIDSYYDEKGVFAGISFKNEEKFNFAFDCVDAIAEKSPDKLAMLWVGNDKSERRFTFTDMKKYSAKTANYFESLGIKKGDTVMLVLKRHYQFWFCMLALHKIGAIAIPATNQLVEHDFTYRYKAAGVKAIVCTADGAVSDEAEKAASEFPGMIKILVGGKKDGWNDFNVEMERFSTHYYRTESTPCGSDPMLMLFTSGTTGYPRIATHSYKYALGHYPTARHWHNVDPDGLHFTISDTGWGKALWGKLYGQWLCEAATFTYDFDRFHSEDILPMFKKYNITTFCAPPTMYRFFIKEDLSKYDLSSIKYATTAGEALNPEVFNQFKKATGLTIMEGFGQTETTLSIANFVGSTPKIGSMGKPSPLYDVVVLDPDGVPCKTGDTGEICIRVKDNAPCGLFIGYYRDEEKTAEVWHDGYYHTGDQATMDEDGYLWYVGRIDDVIKSSGYRIGPFEIESVIMELPYVLECAITPVPDEVRGQIVKATIVLTRGTVGTPELKKEIQEYVKTHTAPYKYPRIVEFVDELPKTISGKVRRVEIRKKDLEKARS
ncbi:MAG: helix-turn-helix domain-containing protein [Ruminococcaceae bacterium]|nr:helix-turn-helix domain-containing protein [Oscillospiraceae bacterium]